MQSQPPSHDSIQPVYNTQNSQNTGERHSRSSLLHVKGSKKYNVKVKSDKDTCDIVSACTLDDGTIILSDFGNKKLKRVDPSSLIVRDCCDVPENPHQVCVISNTEVAVCCSRSQLIQFVSVGSTMKKARQIDTDYYCYGLAYADRKLFVSEYDSVYVYTVSGDKLQQFVLGDISRSRLAVSSDNLNIYVASNNKGLIILDSNGSSIGGFNGPELDGAYDVCLHNSGHVLVCGHDSKNILQFSPDGKLIGEVLKSDKRCTAVYCDKNNSKLFVGFKWDNEIEVYDISG
jgi:hypothetical protein